LTVNAAATAPSITSQPANQTVTAGQTASFSLVATGTSPMSYQGRKNGVNISGATASSYTTPVTTTTDNGSAFSVVVTNSAGSATSNNATLTVNAASTAPSITSQPANQTVTAGQTANFSVAAIGTSPMSYQWRKNGVSISGATASSYTTPATTSTDSGSAFSVLVTNSAGSASSNNATLTVNSANVAPSITTQPANQTVTVGQTATFSVLATGTGTLSYQWKKNGTNVSGATGNSYTTPATTATDTGSSFSVVVSHSAGSITSNNAMLTVNTAPAPSGGGRLVLSTNRLIFYADRSAVPSPKMIKVTSSTGAAMNFTADVYGGSWISITPSAGTTPGQISVSAFATGLTGGTYSCVIKISANGTTKRVYVVLVVGRGSGDDGESDDSEVRPFSFDPGAKNTAQAMWLDGHGVPYTSKKDPTNQGLVLRKNPSGPSSAIAGASLKDAAGSQLTTLSFDMRSDSECSKGAPQFVIVTADEVVHKASCATGTIQPLAVPGWQRVSFNPANGAQLSPAVAPGMAVKTIALVMDHSTGTGMAVLDNINVNGKYIGRE
jgi:Immunoglobulin I-set domain